jgi:hypothetical protein
MRLTRWTIALYMGLVFLCGGVVGAFAHRLYTVSTVSANTRNPEEFRKRYLADLQARLKLSDNQVAKVNSVMDDTRTRFRAARVTIEPEMRKIREDQQREISELLSPEQQAEWQKIVEERERNRKNKKRGTTNSGSSRTP